MYRVSAIVDKGNFKKKNDDRVLINQDVFMDTNYEETLENRKALFAVADGVGGEKAGDVAAGVVLHNFSRDYESFFCEAPEYAIKTTTQNCFDELAVMAKEDDNLSGMATTLTGLLVTDDKVITFNLGNSRVYRYRAGFLKQLTTDDSVVQEMIDMGSIQASQRNDMPNSNVITKYIGSNEVSFDIAVVEHNIKLLDGDIFMLTSDGIHDCLAVEAMEDVLGLEELTLSNRAQKIVDMVKEKDEHDNISIILVEVTEDNGQ